MSDEDPGIGAMVLLSIHGKGDGFLKTIPF